MRTVVEIQSLLLSSSFILGATAIFVAPDSTCAVNCGNVLQSTSTTDLVCGDTNYASTNGQVFESCVNCEVNSTYVDPATKESDLSALLYNLRYTANYCLFNESSVASTPCITSFACESFEGSLRHGNLSTTEPDFGYCDAWNDFMLEKCQECLISLGNQQFLANYLTALSAGCQQKPAAGSTLSLSGTFFSGSPIKITSPEPQSSIIASTFNPPTGPLTLGAKIGIIIGSVLVLLIILGCIIIWRGKRHRRAVLAQYEKNQEHMAQVRTKWRPFSKHEQKQQLDISPQSESGKAFTNPSASWAWTGNDDSPQSSSGQHFSPYASNYSSPISPEQGRVRDRDWMPIRTWGMSTSGGGSASGSGLNAGNGLGQEEDAIELSPINAADRERWAREAGQVGFVPAPPPTIRHPGLGRNSSEEENVI